MRSQFGLLTKRRFLPYFITQFLGACNDNIFKNALFVLITFGTLPEEHHSSLLISLSAGLFIFPFIIFSALAGQLADKYDKSRIIRIMRFLEIGIMGLAAFAFYWSFIPGLIFLLFLAGAQSSFFGPVKYSILPVHLKEDELTAGNGLVETGTFLAILLGSVLGTLLMGVSTPPYILMLVLMVISIISYCSSRFIPSAPACAPDLVIQWNLLQPILQTLARVKRQKSIFLSIMGISWFWFYGALILTQLPSFAHFLLGGDETVITLLLMLFCFGIGTGSLLCHRLGNGHIEMALVPFGSIGLSAFAIDIGLTSYVLPETPMGFMAALHHTPYWHTYLSLIALGVFAGFYIVPLYTWLQLRTNVRERSQMIAANNIMNSLFMVASAGVSFGLFAMGLTIQDIFLVVACLNIGIAVYLFKLFPEVIIRFLTWMLVHTFYRFIKIDTHHIPKQGGAILVCNHVSFLDPLLIMASTQRPIRFIMDHGIFKNPFIGFIFRAANCIPIVPSKENKKIHDDAFDSAALALARGELVGIFPEGEITLTGNINPFKSGIERLVARSMVPVIPLAVQGLWGSFFSRRYGKVMKHFPRRFFWSKLGIVAGAPIPPEEVTKELLFERVSELRGHWK